MSVSILLTALVVISCVALNKISHKIGIPMLLAFIILGMLFGSDGIFRITFENYLFSEQICSAALIFIMFYGGFGTNWEQAKPIAVKAGFLSTAGVVLTAALTGIFCHTILKIGVTESFLIGAVISSTDAASVFSILRSKKLGLKDNTDSLLEIESGSNDPSSYMLTVVALAIMGEGIQADAIFWMIAAQLVFGCLVGIGIALGTKFILFHFHFGSPGFDMIFVVGVALLSYSLANAIGGNGYLSAYICGIILGNVKIRNKNALVNFFDGITGLMQMLIFFLLGLLSTPSKIPFIFIPALSIMLFLSLVARPAAVFAILAPFKCSIRQKVFVSFAGLRGAASIVFAIMAITREPLLHNDVFHIVFCIVLLSIGFQGSFLPLCARWLRISDPDIDVMKSFSDYSDEGDLEFIRVRISGEHAWANQPIKDIILPPETLIILVIREKTYIIPDGETVLYPKDVAVLSAYQFSGGHMVFLREEVIHPGSKWAGRTIQEYSPHSGELVVMIIRRGRTIMPTGGTVIEKRDVLVISALEQQELIVKKRQA